ncbi:MAG: rhodanese-like domain-containing protein [Campylobacterota bacterium]|nr:rhodanese-like domain-containing protein [Campylobacterota bacterium]
MKYFLSFLLLFVTTLFAEVKHQYVDQKLLDSGIQIVDIRTPGEWKDTGLVQGSIPIMFFNERGGYNVEQFLNELNQKIDTKKEFALICNSGSRTRILADFLSKKLGYNVIDLKGGIRYGMGKNIPLESYKGK